MMRRLSPVVTIFAGLAASCASTPVQESRSPKAERELADALTGRAAGQPVRCIPNYRTSEMHVIDDWTILFREGRTVYVQKPPSGCRGLGIGGYTLVTRPFGVNQVCEGDINQLVDLRTGFNGGACVFGPFVPYTKAS